MNTENLIKACDSARFLADELRAARKDARESGNMFAVVWLGQQIERADLIAGELATVRPTESKI